MSTQTAEIKDKAVEILKKHYVKKSGFFGSIVRDELTKESDIALKNHWFLGPKIHRIFEGYSH